MKNKGTCALIAILLAFGMWLYVITVVSPDQTRPYHKVPVVLDHQDALADNKLMLVSDPNPTVTVELTGTRSDLNKINSANLTAVADLSAIEEPGDYLVGYSVTPPNDLVRGAITVRNREPRQISVTVARKQVKEVPVQILYEGSVAEGYIKGTPELDVTEVKVSGPEEVVSQIHHAAIRVDLKDRKTSVAESFRYELQNEQNEPLDVQMITTNVEQINLQLRISAIKKVDLKVKVINGGGATAETCEILYKPEQISISGSEAILKDLNELVIGTINLADFSTSAEKEFEIVLPDGVTNESGVSTASVHISFPKLDKRVFDIKVIHTKNVPEGMEADVLTKVLTVTVRGPKDQIAALQMSDITASVDVANVSGAEIVEPVITISDRFPDVGAVGKYGVSVSVSPKPTAPAPEPQP